MRLPRGDTRLTRRGLLVATAACVPLAAVLLEVSEHNRHHDCNWPTGVTYSPPSRSSRFRGPAGTGARRAAPVIERTSDTSLQIAAFDDTLFHLGQPVQGHFALRAEFETAGPLDRLGLFFRYRPHQSQSESTVAHPLQVIELAPGEAKGTGCSGVATASTKSCTGRIAASITPWAETPVDFAPRRRTGASCKSRSAEPAFRMCSGMVTRLSPARWTLSWQARHMSQQTRDELKHAYLGRLGIFARSSTAVFSRLQLRYLDEQEIL